MAVRRQKHHTAFGLSHAASGLSQEYSYFIVRICFWVRPYPKQVVSRP